jgi:dihydrofolate reductase
MPKYVVSSSVDHAAWSNATVIKGEDVPHLKESLAGELLVFGSRQLVHSLVEANLVDELRLTVYPVILGAGDRLLPQSPDKRPLRLLDTRTIGTGLTHLTYEVVRQR